MIATLREKAYRHIRRKIQHRELAAGSRLEELVLAKELGVSRVPVREAICRLESEGLISQVPRLGAFVKVPDRDDVSEWLDLRAALEGYAAAKVAEEATSNALARITDVHRRMLNLARQIRAEGLADLKNPRGREWEQIDLEFHLSIVHATNNRAAAKLISNLHIRNMFFDTSLEPVRRMASRVCKEHGRVLRAIRRRDVAEARRAMDSHLMIAKQISLEDYDSGRHGAYFWNNTQP